MGEETAATSQGGLELELQKAREQVAQLRLDLERERASRADLAQSLREAEERTQSLYDKAPVMLHSIDRQGRLLSVSDHWLAVLGYTRSEVLGRRSTEFLTAESQRYARETILPDYFQTGFCTDVPYQMQTKSGEVRDVLLSAIAERDAEGQIARSFAVINDVTERKQIEEEFHRAQKLESLGVLASGVAHDFNNLLVGIYGFLDLALVELPDGATARDYVFEAKTAAGHATELVAQLLAYAGKGATAKQAVDLNEVVAGMTDLLRTSASKKITIDTDLEHGLPNVHADVSQMRQIVLNLVTNAAQAIGDVPGRITVRTSTSCGRCPTGEPACKRAPRQLISLQVEDTGPGLEPTLRDRVFDPFFTTKPGGNGLGLAAVHGILHGHGGTVWVESEPGQGSTFCACLPVQASEASPGQTQPAPSGQTQPAAPARTPTPHAQAAPSTAWTGTGLVLLADDESVVRRVGQRMLERLGFEVVSVTDGEEAVAALEARGAEVRCAVIDYSMPTMNGTETFHALRALQPELPVVLATGYARPETIDALLEAGLAACIQKPYALDELRRVLRLALGD